jgi:signal transduction histidine kinase/phage shock protein PspC (stress-responsive transcriptional regulator)
MVGPVRACHDDGTMSAHTVSPREFRKAYRETTSPMIGGVAAGVARHLALDPLLVRVGFVGLAAMGGLGIALYAGLWLFLPAAPHLESDLPPGLAAASRRGMRPGGRSRWVDLGPVVALGAVAVGVVFVLQALFGGGAWLWPLVVAGAGLILLWRQADASQRDQWLDAGGRLSIRRVVFGRGGFAAYLRVFGGITLLVLALILFAVLSGRGGPLGQGVMVGLLALVGLGLVISPWVRSLIEDLAAERGERVRTEERADMAAHLHDSVLQTLALIQKNAGDSAAVARLARSQERDLRSWLYAGERADETTVASALRRMAAEVEDAHGVTVDVVTVGDRELTEDLRPIVSAAREAVTNAAKHAGVPQVDVYAEIADQQTEVFVRDRGTGFDTSVAASAERPGHRFGIRHSIIDRMARHGGSADIRSTPGEGTEVRLSLAQKP